MTKYPVFKRWIVRLPPEERHPFLLSFSAQLQGRMDEVNSLLRGDVHPWLDSPPQEEVIEVANIPLPPGSPIEISDDEEPLADIEDLLKDSAEEDNVEVSNVTAPPFSFSELDTEGDIVLEDLDLSSAAVSTEVTEDALEDAMDNVNNLPHDDMEDALPHAEENVGEDSMDISTDVLKEALKNAIEEITENVLEEVIEDATDIAEGKAAKEAAEKAAKDSNVRNEDPINLGAVQEVSENVEAVDEVPTIGGAAQEISEDPEVLDLEGEDFAPLATSAKNSASAEAFTSSNTSPSYQENPKLTIWTAIFYPAPKIFVNLRFRSNAGYHLRHTPVESRPEEYISWKWPLSAQIPTGMFYLILYI